MSVCDRVCWVPTAFCFRVSAPVMSCGGAYVCHFKQFMLLLETCVSVTFLAFFPLVFYILSLSVKVQMPEVSSVY